MCGVWDNINEERSCPECVGPTGWEREIRAVDTKVMYWNTYEQIVLGEIHIGSVAIVVTLDDRIAFGGLRYCKS